MWLLALAPLAQAATLYVDSDSAVDLSVDDDRSALAPGQTAEVKKVDGGTVRVEVRVGGESVVWAGDLALPDDAEVWLAWKQGSLVLVKASRRAGQEAASGASRAANTLLGIGAAAQATSDVLGATSKAAADFEAAQSGEVVESSDTRVEVTAGAGGVSSRPSRTTAGEAGVPPDGTSTSIGPDGVARSTTETDVGFGTASTSTTDDRVSRIAIPGDESFVVSLVQVDVGAPPPAPAAVVASAPKPKSLWYREPAPIDVGGAHWTFHDPVAEADAFKLQIRVAVTGDHGVVWDPTGASATFDGAVLDAGRGKPLAVVPGGDDRHTLGFASEGKDLRADLLVLEPGQALSIGKGADLGLGTVEAVPDASTTASDLTCTVKSAAVAKTSTSVTLSCANGGSGWRWLWPAAAGIAFGDAAPTPNAARKQTPLLLAPGAEEKLFVEVAVGTKSGGTATPRAHLAGVGLAAEVTPLALPSLALEVDPERTAEEN